MYIQQTRVRILVETGRRDEAEAMALESLEVRRRTTPREEGTGRTLLHLGQVLVEKGRLDEAGPFLQEALALFREHYAMKPELAAQAANWLGTIQTAHGAYPEAEALLLSNPQVFSTLAAAMSPAEKRTAIGHIVKLYQAWNKPEQAAAWQKKLDELAKPQISAKAQ